MTKATHSAALAALLAGAAKIENVAESAVHFISGIPDLIRNAAEADDVDTSDEDSQLSQLATDLETKAAEIGAAIAANTPASGTSVSTGSTDTGSTGNAATDPAAGASTGSTGS